jgi:hypothetical protein
MSFTLFASATGDFVRERDGLDFGDAFEMGDMLGRLQSPPGTVADAVGGELAGALESPSALERLTTVEGQMLGGHLFEDALKLTVAHFHRFNFAITATESHLAWPDTGGFWSGVVDSPSDQQRRDGMEEAAPYCIRHVVPVLRDADMLNFGVLAAMARVLAEWTLEVSPSRRLEMIQFILRH